MSVTATTINVNEIETVAVGVDETGWSAATDGGRIDAGDSVCGMVGGQFAGGRYRGAVGRGATRRRVHMGVCRRGGEDKEQEEKREGEQEVSRGGRGERHGWGRGWGQ